MECTMTDVTLSFKVDQQICDLLEATGIDPAAYARTLLLAELERVRNESITMQVYHFKERLLRGLEQAASTPAVSSTDPAMKSSPGKGRPSRSTLTTGHR